MFARGDKLEKGHYTVIKEIGVGGMGVVYHCRDEQLMRDVAVKMLLPELMADKANLEVFHQEARLAAQLEHPNVVTVYDVGVEEKDKKQHHYVCMEYLPGGNLANRVISGPLAIEHCLNWMKQLASGLTYAHKRGVVHQDVKADNIFITNEGDLKIGDFGLARLLVGRVHYNAQTKGMGTPAYMSPELCRGEPQDHRSDIYSLGVLFFEMATGQLPFRARGMIEMATKHSSAPVPSAKRINPLVPEILDKVIKRMMAKTPEERYATMSEVLTILDDLIFELRVARLGLGNRPMLRSGNVHAELLAHAQSQGQTLPPIQNATSEVELPEPRGQRAPVMKPDTEPQTTSLPPPVDQSVVKQLGADNKQKQPMSASEKLIAQLENSVPLPPKTQTSDPSLRMTPPRNTPRSLAGHFVDTRQIAPLNLDTASGAQAKRAEPEPEAKETQLPARQEAPASERSTAAPPPPPRPPQAKAQSISSSSLPAQSTSGVHDVVSEPVQLFSSKPQATPKTTYSKLPKMRRGPLMKSLKSGLELLWTFNSHGPIGWNSSPVCDREERVVYVTSGDGTVYAIDALSGQEKWHRKLGAPIVASPVLAGERVLAVCSNGLVCAMSAHDGAIVWRFDARDALVATPIVFKDLMLIPSSGGKLLAIETDGGLQRWQYKTESPIVCAPYQHGNLTLFGTKHGDFHAVSTESGRRAWRFLAGSPISASAAASVDSVYFGTESGVFNALDVESGRLIWEYSTHEPIVAKAAIAFTSVLFCSHDKWLYCCERYDGGLRWKGALRGKVLASVAATRDTAIVMGRDGWIQSFSVNNGEQLWQRDVGRSLESAPLLTADRLYFGTVEGDIVAYSFASPAVLSDKSA